MKKNLLYIYLFTILSINFISVKSQTILYTMPEEIGLHEGTWLQWQNNP